ncbi:MAG: filamentous hemagglutinin N-terminal domain-containing protein, partial [Chlamydiota bacterium]
MKKFPIISTVVMLSASTLAFANPKGLSVVQGSAVLSNPDSSTVQITTGQQTILNWNSFSIERHEKTTFVMPNSSASVLNRVLGGNLSRIFGSLEANGQVFLINPNGILVGTDAVVNTASFIASSFDILDSVFLNGDIVFASTGKGGPVINMGTILATEGDVLLNSRYIQNTGTIEALSTEDLGGRVFLTAKYGSIQTSGTVRAKNQNGLGGEIQIIGSDINIGDGALIDVSNDLGGGRILIGGDHRGENPDIFNASISFISASAQILANANVIGNGGEVVIWSDVETSFLGLIEIKGGRDGGDGGLAEVSSKGYLNYQGMTDATAPLGMTGTLYMDPTNITIINSGGSGTAFGPGAPCAANTFCGNGGSNLTLTDSQIVTALASANITVDASAGVGPDAGNISFNPAVDITFATPMRTLTFLASGNIDIEEDVTINATGNASHLVFTANSGNIIVGDGTQTGDIALTTVGGGITFNCINFSSQVGLGTIMVQGTTSLTINASGTASFLGIANPVADQADRSMTYVSNGLLHINTVSNIIISGPQSLTQNLTNCFVEFSGRATLLETTTGDLTITGAQGDIMALNTFQDNSVEILAINLMHLDIGGSINLEGGTIPQNSSTMSDTNPVQIKANSAAAFTIEADTDINFSGHAALGSVRPSEVIIVNNNQPISVIQAGGNINSFDNDAVTIYIRSSFLTPTAAGTQISAGSDIIFSNGTNVFANGPMVITTGRDYTQQSSATLGAIVTFENGDLDISAGRNFTMIGTPSKPAVIQSLITPNGSITLACDASTFMCPVLAGPYSFSMNLDSVLSIGNTGTIKIYTAVRSQNNIATGLLINGMGYVPGPMGVTTTTEAWGVCSPGTQPPAVGNPFSIYYKQLDPPPPP